MIFQEKGNLYVYYDKILKLFMQIIFSFRFESATSKFINDNWLYYTIACSSYKYP